MPYYVDIGVVRIQRYLSRTPTLLGRRNASAALAAATGTVDQVLRGRARVNEQAGKVDGVLSLVLDRPDAEADTELVSDVLEHLRAELPGAEFQVLRGCGEDYLRAYTDSLRPMAEGGDAQVDLPAGAEFPGVALCGVCRVDPAVGRVRLRTDDGEQDERDACADCVMRHAPETRQEGRSTERDLADAVGAVSTPPGFNELAGLAGQGNKEHLATVHADGNAVGRFFAALARVDGVDHAAMVAELTRCTRDALAAATCAVRLSDDPMLCVVPHLLGGDDVLVSLPADRAWPFTVEFVRDFGQRMTRLVRGLGDTDLTPPTMSAGVVFGRRNYPFALTVEHAEHLLRRAKSAGAGKAAWIGFADVVADGAGVTGATGPDGDRVSLAALLAHREDLGRLVGLSRSNRYRLAEALGRGGSPAARTLAARLGHTEVIGPFLLEETSAGDDETIELGTALRIARWWR